uniref:Uncharacterized protein n=1 Tax=Arundo donax TaxID=35708 RepID=A0A0A9AJX8_ARUDO
MVFSPMFDALERTTNNYLNNNHAMIHHYQIKMHLPLIILYEKSPPHPPISH